MKRLSLFFKSMTKGQVAVAVVVVAVHVWACWSKTEYMPFTNWPMYAYMGKHAQSAERVRLLATTDKGVQLDISHPFATLCQWKNLDPLVVLRDKDVRAYILGCMKQGEKVWLGEYEVRRFTLRRETWVYEFSGARIQRIPREEVVHDCH